MMKKIKKIQHSIGMAILVCCTILTSCQDDDHNFGDITNPSNIDIETTVLNVSEENPNGDGSGMVEFSASADDAITYKFFFGDNSSVTSASGETSHRYTRTGTHEYTVTVKATGKAGVASTSTRTITVYSEFDDPEVKQALTGGSSKTWYIAAALPAHLGVGPIDGDGPAYYSAAPFEKETVNGEEGCLYDDSMTFSLTDNDQIMFDQVNNGSTFFNAAFNGMAGGGGPDDQCLPYDTSGEKAVSLAPIDSEVPEDQTTGTQIIINDGGFLAYFLNVSSYEILEITDNFMHVRCQMGQGGDQNLAWYLKLTTDPEGGSGSDNTTELNTQFTNQVWADEFNTGTEPSSENWNYEIGNNNGWGNQELQYYTDDNAVIEDGMLKIKAIAENTEGYDYSSSRITTEDKFEFTYGRLEASIELPEGGGVWPAFWMLGADYATNGWPACGEIDVMEFNGYEPDLISATLHYPENFGANGNGEQTTVSDASSTFHTYTVEWREDAILFAVDGQVFHEFENNPDTTFNDPFFIILNVAMGGNFVGNQVDPDFEQSEMKVDWVRLYQ